MSYCVAWKKENCIYMVAESAVSALQDEVEQSTSAFGEEQGLYGKFYVQEGVLKIFEIQHRFLLAFAGDVEKAEELLKHLYSFGDMLTLQMMKDSMLCNYQNAGISVLVAECGARPNLYYFDGTQFNCVEEQEIGTGKANTAFSQNVRTMREEYYQPGMEQHDYLAQVICGMQCCSVKDKLIQHGFGGTFYGAMADTRVSWFRDMGYYFFEDNIQEGSIISVIHRQHSVFTASSITDCTTFILNRFLDLDFWNDPYSKRAVKKSVQTKNPYYFILYSKVCNVILFVKANCELQNQYYLQWIKRGDGRNTFAFAFSPRLDEFFTQHQREQNMLPSLIPLPCRPNSCYMDHDSVLPQCDVADPALLQENKHMDFDFSVHQIKNYDPAMVIEVKRKIGAFHNLVLVDFQYFYRACERVYNRYSGLRELHIDQIDLSTLATNYLQPIAEADAQKYLFVFVKAADQTAALGDGDLEQTLSRQNNCVFIQSSNPETDFCGTVFQLMKNYYINDRFFHLDKLVIMADNPAVDQLLEDITPQFNFKNKNPDILLIRNLNGDTDMYVRLRYAVTDYWIPNLFGISMDELAQLDSLIEYYQEQI